MRDDEPDFGDYVAECQGCEEFASVGDLGLCADCSGKLERDMIRQRAWDYSATAYGVPPERLEKLRSATIAEYGAAFELIVPDSEAKKPPGRGRSRKAR